MARTGFNFIIRIRRAWRKAKLQIWPQRTADVIRIGRR